MGVSVVRVLPTTRLIPAPRRAEWPSVGVVLATRNRPNLLRRALASVSKQDYPGEIRIVVVFDGVRPDWRLGGGRERPVLVLENWRTKGPAGARNAGILAVGDCELVAFCDDDDVWLETKLTTQVAAMRRRPGTHFATCAAEVEYNGRRTPRLTGLLEVAAGQLTAERVGALARSGFVARQSALATAPSRGGIGLLAEDAPAEAQDWDLLLRAARRAPILHIDLPLVRVLWRHEPNDSGSFTAEIQRLRWLLGRHPELGQSRAAAALHADIAGWAALAGDPATAWAATRQAVRACWYHPRAGLAALATAGLLRGRPLLAALRRRRLP